MESFIKEDNVDELSTILNSNEYLRNKFNTFKTIRVSLSDHGENIYHVVY